MSLEKCVKQIGAPFTMFTKHEFKGHGQSILPIITHFDCLFNYINTDQAATSIQPNNDQWNYSNLYATEYPVNQRATL